MHSVVSRHCDVTAAVHHHILATEGRSLVPVVEQHPEVEVQLKERDCRILVTGDLMSVQAAIVTLTTIVNELVRLALQNDCEMCAAKIFCF